MPISKVIDWQIESIRVTMFVNGSLNPNLLETWLMDISTNSPLQVSKKPSSFEGISESAAGILSTKWTANRLDVVLSSKELIDGNSIASLSDATPLFTQYFDSIPEIGDLPLVDRIALGLKLFFEVSNETEGHEILSKSIVGLSIPKSAGDFLYRVNIPCESHTIDGLKINRLATWSVGQGKVVRVQIKPDGSQEEQTISELPTAIRLELDINTNQTAKLGLHLDRSLLHELQHIAMEVASGGEAQMQK